MIKVKFPCVLTQKLKVVLYKNSSEKQTKAKEKLFSRVSRLNNPCEGLSDILNTTDHGANLKIKVRFEVDGGEVAQK